jgi:hypothetical protein
VPNTPDLEQAYIATPFEQVPSLPALVRRVLKLCDGERSGHEACRLAGITPAQQGAVVGKLIDLGLLRPAFAPEEEAFFAAEVEVGWEDEPARPRLRDSINSWLLTVAGR